MYEQTYIDSGVYRMKLGLRLLLVEPDAENRAVTPTRLANSNYRSREHLTPDHDTRAIPDSLRHRNISNTVRYTELSPTRFKDFWRDYLPGASLADMDGRLEDKSDADIIIFVSKHVR